MLKLYDYIYYRTYRVYKYKWKDDDPGMYSRNLVSIFQFINIVSVFYFIKKLLDSSCSFSKIEWGIFMIIIGVANYIRYKYFKPINQLELKWDTKSCTKM